MIRGFWFLHIGGPLGSLRSSVILFFVNTKLNSQLSVARRTMTSPVCREADRGGKG